MREQDFERCISPPLPLRAIPPCVLVSTTRRIPKEREWNIWTLTPSANFKTTKLPTTAKAAVRGSSSYFPRMVMRALRDFVGRGLSIALCVFARVERS